MNNFTYYNPVKVLFGRDVISNLPKLIEKKTRVLITYGQGSVKRNGVLDKVVKALSDYEVLLFGGIEPNPKYETLMGAVKIAIDKKVGFILAVGGGSVLDGTKFIAAASNFSGEQPWDILSKGAKVQSALPIGSVITLPATGSEVNSGSVISRISTKEKLVFQSDHVFPRFAIMDPTTTFSLPKDQTANGIVDAFIHVLEQYLTLEVNTPLQDRQAEAVLHTLIEEAPKVLANSEDYHARANIMWSASHALNKILGCGTVSDWSTHLIGHELSALFDIAHARSLAVVLGPLLRSQIQYKEDKLVKFGERIWGVTEGTFRQRAIAAIGKTEEFFNSMGVETSIKAYSFPQEELKIIPERFKQRNFNLGENKTITPEVVSRILSC
jgi:NADP-dependent alcohol dehydrogenase